MTLSSRTRQTVSYKRYKWLLKQINKRIENNESNKILLDVHEVIDHYRGYHSLKNAYAAERAIDLLLEENK